jgi:cell division protein FtsL
MAYYGNLALRPERQPQGKTRTIRETTTVIRRRTISVGEKLIYLLSVAIIVLVAGVIINRYAQIYEINQQIVKTNAKVDQMTLQVNDFQREVERLSSADRIIKFAKDNGMIVMNNSNGIKIEKSSAAVVANNP